MINFLYVLGTVNAVSLVLLFLDWKRSKTLRKMIEDSVADTEQKFSAAISKDNEFEKRQNHADTRQSEIEHNHKILADKQSETEQKFADLHHTVHEKKSSIYTQPQGSVVCSRCGHTVSRFFYTDSGSPVCANCDSAGFQASLKG